MLEGCLTASSEMICTNEKIKRNTQDTNRSWYVPEANVDHTIIGQLTAMNTLDHSAIIPRRNVSF